MTILVTRLAGYESAGVLSLAMSISASFQTLALFGIRNFQVSDIHGKYTDSCYVGLRNITCVSAFVFCLLFTVVNSYETDSVAATLWFMLFWLAEDYSDVFHGIFQKNGKLYIAGQSFFIKGINAKGKTAMNLIQLKRFIRKNNITRKFADKLYLQLTGQLQEERHCKKGGTPYYVIRPPKSDIGIVGLYIDVIRKIDYALSKGYKPVVDFLNYKTVYSGGSFEGKGNVWEWYFEQPFGYSLDEAYKNDYILSPMAGSSDLIEDLLKGNLNLLRHYCNVAQNIKFCDRARENIDKRIIDLRGGGLGVFCRGTDYTQYKPIGHPVQPERKELIKMAREKMQKWSCNYIFLTTEEKESVDEFNIEFPGKVITVDQQLVENYSINTGLLIEDFKATHGVNRYQSGLDYLTSVAVLAKCDCFLGALAGGSVGALIMNHFEYREKEVINLGTYI